MPKFIGGGKVNTPTQIADGVEQSNLGQQAGILGFEDWFGRSLPKFYGTSTSGGGVATSNEFGLHMEAGGSSGDLAVLDGTSPFIVGATQDMAGLKLQFLFQTRSATPYSDMARIGNEGAYLDLKNGEYHVSNNFSSSTSATLPGENTMQYLEIEADHANGETHFTAKGPVNETATVAEIPKSLFTDKLVRLESNGNNDQLDLIWFRGVILP